MNRFLIAVFLVVVGFLFFWMWSRSGSLTKAQRALDAGNPGKAVEILVKVLEKKEWPASEEEILLEMLAKSYINKGTIDPAEKTYRTLREKFPNNFEGAIGLGALNLMRGMDSFGVEHLLEAKKINPKDIRSHVLLASHFINRRDYAKATSHLTDGLLLFPDNLRLMELSGDLFFNQGRYIDAISQFNNLLNSAPQDKNLKIKVARAYLYVGDLTTSFDLLESVRPSFGTDEGLELLLSNILHQKGERREAARIVERLYLEDNRRFDSGLAWIVYLGSFGRMEEAERLLSKIGENLLPLGGGLSHPVAGQTFMDLERLQGWREMALRHHIYYFQVRSILAGMGNRYSEAEKYLERAINLDSGDFGTIEKFVDLFRLKNDPEESLKWANRAIATYKDHPAAHLMKARIFLDLKRNQDAISEIRIVMESYPSLSLPYALLSRALMLEGKFKPGLVAANKSVHLNPGSPDAQLSLAIALNDSGQVAAAEKAFINALNIDPRFAEARFEWAMRLKKLGRYSEANTQFEEAEKLEPLRFKRTINSK
ncbi:MAG: tetratricopeptide repeat protein [Elusimicrobia bacterium]|nr:tetratricopeptide repeat protein [Elusimicrobiota bacterium]